MVFASQFERWGCENCPFLDMISDRARVLKCTSGTFDGYQSCSSAACLHQYNQRCCNAPTTAELGFEVAGLKYSSWLTRLMFLTLLLAKLHRGVYAVQVHGRVPDDILQELNKSSMKRKAKSNA